MRIVTITACAFAVMLMSQSSHAQFGPANVVVNEVIERPVAPVQTFVASVMPLRKSTVGSAVEGRVEQFLHDETNPTTKLTYVTKGQPLANLREGTVRIKLDEAVAQHQLRTAEYEEAQQNQPGLVARGEAKLKAATANYQFAKNQYDRNKQLFENNRSISRETFEQARTDMYLAEQAYIEARSEEAAIKRADRVRQTKARLDEAEAVLRELQDRVEKYTIVAPFDGFVVAEHTEVGAWIKSGDPVADVVQLDPAEVRAFVPERYVGRLQLGGSAAIRPNFPLAEGQRIPLGTITGIVAEARTGSRTFPVKIQVANSDHILKSGMLTEVELAIGEKQASALVPKDALVLGGRTATIYLAVPNPEDTKNSIAKVVPVKQGASVGKWIAVTPIGDEELSAGDLVVEKGNERLRPGAPLLVNRNGATPPPE